MFSQQHSGLKKSLWYASLLALALTVCSGAPEQVLGKRPGGRDAWVPMEQITNFEGPWKTTYGRLTLRISGDRVTGQYDNKGTVGDLRGTVNGNMIQGKWSDDKYGKGSFQFVMNPDGRSFRGTWTQHGNSQYGDWDGWR